MSQPDTWRIKKEVNPVEIFTILTVLIGAVWMFAQYDKRIELNSAAISSVKVAQDVTNKRLDDSRAELNAHLATMNAKLDRIIERQIDR